MASKATNEVIAAYQTSLFKLFGSSRFSDLIVKYDEVEFRVHKAILCSQVQFFENACTGGFKESAENVIDLSGDAAEFGPTAVRVLLEFCYRCNYDETADSANLEHKCLLHIQAYAIAAKYDLIGLQKHAVVQFEKDSGDLSGSKHFAPAVAIIYKTNETFRDLRNIVVEIAWKDGKDLQKEEAFRELLKGEAAFANDLALNFCVKGESGVRDYWCPTKDQTWRGTPISDSALPTCLLCKGKHWYESN